MAIVIIVVFALLRFGFGKMTTALHNVNTPTNPLNLSISNASDQSFGQFNAGVQNLKIVGICMIVGMILTMFLTSFIAKAHPVFKAGYVLVLILAVILAIVLSMYYQQMKTDPTLAEAFGDDKMGDFLMNSLPVWVTIIGFVNCILLFSGINKDEGMGGGIG